MDIHFSEKLLQFSPKLAAQIGLEEAVLAQLVFESSHFCPTKTVEGVDWFYMPAERWTDLLSFWDATKINAMFLNLERRKILDRQFIPNGQFLIRLLPNSDIDAAQGHTQDNSERQQNPSGLPAYMDNTITPTYKTAMTPEWTPDPKFVVPRLHAETIPNDFVLEQMPNFRGYYIETGTLAADWNSRFVRWVKSEWAKLARPSYKPGTHNERQEKRDEVRRKIMDINDINW